MGWAARTKVGKKAVPDGGTMRYVSVSNFDEATRRGGKIGATFSDRSYEIDKKGTFRRAKPSERFIELPHNLGK